MSVSDTQQTGRSGSAVSGAATTRLSGSRLFLARAVWLALVVPSLGFFVIGLPTYDQQLQRPCDGPVSCNVVGALTARGLHALLSLGFSASEYAAFTIIFWTVILAI